MEGKGNSTDQDEAFHSHRFRTAAAHQPGEAVNEGSQSTLSSGEIRSEEIPEAGSEGLEKEDVDDENSQENGAGVENRQSAQGSVPAFC